MRKNTSVKWRSEPEKHDYPAAEKYLSLTLGQRAAKDAAAKLKRAKMSEFAAKDIFRASKLSLLGVSNSHVEKDRAKIIQHEKLSPLLLGLQEVVWVFLATSEGWKHACEHLEPQIFLVA
jgi:hypothetical protein